MPSVQMEGVCYSVFIFAVSLFFYWKIHWRRLDYSLDTSFFGFFNTATMKNESSRVHASLGLVAGAVWQVTTPWCYFGLFLFFLYTIRNLKHLKKMHKGFRRLGIPAPAAIRSSMTRQQMQFQTGVGLGSLVMCLIPEANVVREQWSLLGLGLITFIVGFIHLTLAPVPEQLKEQLREALKGEKAQSLPTPTLSGLKTSEISVAN